MCLEGVPRYVTTPEARSVFRGRANYVTTPEARSVFRGRAKIRDNSRGT